MSELDIALLNQLLDKFCWVISYAHEDKEAVIPIYELLQQKEFRCWMDLDLIPGQNWHEMIMQRIKDGLGLLLFLSPKSVASPYCREEWQLALKLKKPIIPVTIYHCRVPTELETIHYLDATQAIREYREVLDMRTTSDPDSIMTKTVLVKITRDRALGRIADKIIDAASAAYPKIEL